MKVSPICYCSNRQKYAMYIFQQLKHEMESLEAWINIREPGMKEKQFGESIPGVEELLRRQDDFEKTVDAQDDKFKSIIRRTEVGEQKVLIEIFRYLSLKFHLCDESDLLEILKYFL